MIRLILILIVFCNSVNAQYLNSENMTDGVNVLNYNAIPDGITDNSAAFQAAINAVIADAKKEIVYIPEGVYYFSDSVTLTAGNVFFKGVGAAGYQNLTGSYLTASPTLKTIFNIGNYTTSGFGTVGFEGVSFNVAVGSANTAIRYTASGNNPPRPMHVKNCRFSGFAKAIEINGLVGTTHTLGFLTVSESIFIRGGYSIYAETGLLGLNFLNNDSEAGGRIYGKIHGNIRIVGNNLEGQNFPIKILGGNLPAVVRIENNYFEVNTDPSVAAVSYESTNFRSKVLYKNNFEAILTDYTNLPKRFVEVKGATLIYEPHLFSSENIVCFPSDQLDNRLTGRSRLGRNGGFLAKSDLSSNYAVSMFLPVEDYAYCLPEAGNNYSNELALAGTVTFDTPVGTYTTGYNLTENVSQSIGTVTNSFQAGDLITVTALVRTSSTSSNPQARHDVRLSIDGTLIDAITNDDYGFWQLASWTYMIPSSRSSVTLDITSFYCDMNLAGVYVSNRRPVSTSVDTNQKIKIDFK